MGSRTNSGGSHGPVLLLSGFGAPGATLRPLARHLKRRGIEATIAPLGLNLACGEASVERLTGLIRRTGTTAIVGHSRGGQLGLVAAVRMPDQIRTLITVGTPWSVGPPDRPGVAQVAQALGYIGRHGIDLLPSLNCGTAACCARFRTDLRATPRAHWTVLWSSSDRVAGADSRPPAHARTSFDLHLGHLAMITASTARTRIADLIEPD